MCIFEFIGDSITEAVNSALKAGKISGITNMTINGSGTTKGKISGHQNPRENKCVQLN